MGSWGVGCLKGHLQVRWLATTLSLCQICKDLCSSQCWIEQVMGN